MIRVPFKLSGDIPKILLGKTLEVKLCETLDECRQQCVDGENGVITKFNQQNRLDQQREAKAILDEPEVESHINAERVDDVLKIMQTTIDDYIYGGARVRSARTAVAKETVEKANQFSALVAAATADPNGALAAQLRAMGVPFPGA